MLTQIVNWQNGIAASDLPPGARHLAHVLALHFMRATPASPGLTALERGTGTTRKTVLAALAVLEKNHLIEVAHAKPLQIWPVLASGTIPLCGGATPLPPSGITPPPSGTIPPAGSGTIPLCGGAIPPAIPPLKNPPFTTKKEDSFVANSPRHAYNSRDPFGLNPANRDADRLVWWADDGRLYAAAAMEAEIAAAIPGRPLRDVLDEIAGWVPAGCAGLTLLTKVRSQIAKQKDFAARRAALDTQKREERKPRGADVSPWT